MKTSITQAILCLCMLLWGVQRGNTQTLDEVITKHLDAIGGADRWRQVNSMKTTSRVSGGDVKVDRSMLSSVRREAETTVLHNEGFREDQHFKVRLMHVIPLTSTLSRIASPDTEEAWFVEDGPDAQNVYSAPKSFYAIDRPKMNLRPFFLDYAQEGHDFALKEEKEIIKGKACYVIEGRLKDGTMMQAYIDAENYYLVKKYVSVPYVSEEDEEQAEKEANISIAQRELGGKKETVKKESRTSGAYYYEDFREVNGYVLPFKETQDEGNDMPVVLKHKEIIINPSVDKAIFQPPAKEKRAEEKPAKEKEE